MVSHKLFLCDGVSSEEGDCAEEEEKKAGCCLPPSSSSSSSLPVVLSWLLLDDSDSCFNGTLTLVQWKSPVEIKQNGRIACFAGGNDQPDALICFLPLSVNNTWTKKTFFGGLSWLFILRRPRFQEPNQKLTMVLNCASCY